MSNWFMCNKLEGWDGRIYMRSVPGQLDVLELTQPLPCGDGKIEAGYRWNGASVGPLRKVPMLGFPKWKHPIATCRHDWRCEQAKTEEERLFADQEFMVDVGRGGTAWEQMKGYFGVRLGAFF
ncbi:MAG: hypothetical protein J7K75_03995 [Desulfuromonas sp.]|nr:hypothetical protein [Desulfuromonas sp.]